MNREAVIDHLKKQKEHQENNGAYEIIPKMVEALSRVDIGNIDDIDVDMLFYMTLYNVGQHTRNLRVSDSNMLDEDKREMLSIIDRYNNNIGFFALALGKIRTTKQDAQKFVKMCIDIHNESDENRILDIAEKAFENGIKGMQAGAASQILCYLKPYIFPILNRHGVDLYCEWLELDLANPRNLKTYIENTREILEFRNENFLFKNLRIIDNVWPPLDDSNSPFTQMTFELLEGIHNNPTNKYYKEQKEELKKYVQDPFKSVFKKVIENLPENILIKLEHEKSTYSRFTKNDYGQGGVYPFYWGALYPKGSKRSENVQLLASINLSSLRFGLSFGDNSKEAFQAFKDKLIQNQLFMKEYFSKICHEYEFGFEEIPDTYHEIPTVENTYKWVEFSDWLDNIGGQKQAHIHRILSREQMLKMTEDEIAAEISETFKLLYPFVLLAIEDNPVPLIEEYIQKYFSMESAHLASPFSEIFVNFEEANWAFDMFKESLLRLGIDDNSLDDQRYALTIDKNQSRIRLDYGMWLILGFRRHRKDDRWIEIAVNTDLYNNPEYELGKFDSSPEGKDYRLYLVSCSETEDNQELLEAFFSAHDHVKESMGHWRASHVKKYHNIKLAKAVFDEEFRKELFENGLDIETVFQPPPPPEPKIWSEIKESLNRRFDREFDLAKCNLHFTDEMRIDLERRISTALKNGKHIVFIGPPGTGKSKLSKHVCEFYSNTEGDYHMSTATSDWSTFETIGGYRPSSDGTLDFRPGVFLKCFRDENSHDPVNKWLIIDEINRADIDKAFGSLFSALTGDNVTLPYEIDNNSVQVLGDTEKLADKHLEKYQFVIHPDWRIIATMNTYDKSSLYEMSYAFMRRLAFVPVEIPESINSELIRSYIEKWDTGYNDEAVINKLAEIWGIINKTRQIGPAIVEDIFKFVKSSDENDFTSAIIMFVLPQFEGLMDEKILEFFKSFTDNTDKKYENKVKLKRFCADYFQIDEDKFKLTDQ